MQFPKKIRMKNMTKKVYTFDTEPSIIDKVRIEC